MNILIILLSWLIMGLIGIGLHWYSYIRYNDLTIGYVFKSLFFGMLLAPALFIVEVVWLIVELIMGVYAKCEWWVRFTGIFDKVIIKKTGKLTTLDKEILKKII